MADFNQFGSAKPPQSADSQICSRYEAMLTDALDGILSEADQTAFDLHIAGCPACNTMLTEVRRGVAWLEMLKSPRPEPPASLVERILAQTSGEATSSAPQAFAQPVRTSNTLLGSAALSSSLSSAAYSSAKVLPFRKRVADAFRLTTIRHTLMQPRLAMTAAMAFFSIALTLNLTGVRLSELHASDLKPSSIKRSFYEANARVVRTFDNMRVVYELESRVRDLQSSEEHEAPSASPAPRNESAPNTTPSNDSQPNGQKPEESAPEKKQSRPRPGSGTSRREGADRQLEFVRFERRITDAMTSAPIIFRYLQEEELV